MSNETDQVTIFSKDFDDEVRIVSRESRPGFRVVQVTLTINSHEYEEVSNEVECSYSAFTQLQEMFQALFERS